MRPLALVVAVAALTACSKPPAPAAPPPAVESPKITAKPAAPPPPLSVDQKMRLENDFTTARRVVEEARALRAQGEQIEREKGRDAANPTLFKARLKYREAVRNTELWVEGDLGNVTKGQVDLYLGAYASERGQWIKEDASMGSKLHE